MTERRAVLITGGSGALGGEIAKYLNGKGYDIILNYNRNSKGADEVIKGLEKGSRNISVRCDITNEVDVVSMFDKIKKEYGRLDCVINNAGIHFDAPVWKLPLEEWKRVMDVNLTGTFLCSKHAIPLMRENGFGRLINISSVVGQRGEFGTSNYAASKSGLFGLTKTLAREGARFNITSNSVVLGYFSIGMIDDVPQEMQERLKSAIPMGRFGEPRELSSLINYLISEDASYITGQVIGINGGYYM